MRAPSVRAPSLAEPLLLVIVPKLALAGSLQRCCTIINVVRLTKPEVKSVLRET